MTLGIVEIPIYRGDHSGFQNRLMRRSWVWAKWRYYVRLMHIVRVRVLLLAQPGDVCLTRRDITPDVGMLEFSPELRPSNAIAETATTTNGQPTWRPESFLVLLE